MPLLFAKPSRRVPYHTAINGMCINSSSNHFYMMQSNYIDVCPFASPSVTFLVILSSPKLLNVITSNFPGA